jgi:hypothetical protein
MDKKDIYEHLAKIYLDASSKKENKKKAYPKVFKNLFLIIIVLVFTFSFVFFNNSRKTKPFNSEVALVLLPDVVKINFHFDPVRKEIYTIDLNNLDLSRFKALGFSIRKANYYDDIILRVEFNTFGEKSEIYLKDIPAFKWQDYKIALSEFKNISDWSKMANFSFVIEEWGVKEKKGIVYIDNLRLLR